MTDQDETADEADVEEPPVDLDYEFEELGDAQVEQITENVTVEGPNGERTLDQIMLTLVLGHKELEDYKRSALVLYQHLDERLQEAQANDNEDIALVLRQVKKSAYGLYLRVQRGDAELLGERDGTYSGYFADDDEPDDGADTDEDDAA